MEYVKPETVAAIKADPFAVATIEAAISQIYAEHRDWSVMSRNSGQIPFDSEDAAVGYYALCALVGREKPPDVQGKVNIGGGSRMDAAAFRMLEEAV